eukprot:gene18794-25339_t
MALSLRSVRGCAPVSRTSASRVVVARPSVRRTVKVTALVGGGKEGGGGNPFDMKNLMESVKKAQGMVQQETQRVQQELAVTEFDGYDEEETVRVIMTGNQEPKSVDITQDAVDSGVEELNSTDDWMGEADGGRVGNPLVGVQEGLVVSKLNQYRQLGKLNQRRQLGKLNQFRQLGKLNQCRQLGKLDQCRQLGKLDQCRQLGKLDQCRQLGKLDQCRQLGKLDQCRQLGKLNQCHQLGKLNQCRQLGKLNQCRQFGKLGQCRQLGKLNHCHQLGGGEGHYPATRRVVLKLRLSMVEEVAGDTLVLVHVLMSS